QARGSVSMITGCTAQSSRFEPGKGIAPCPARPARPSRRVDARRAPHLRFGRVDDLMSLARGTSVAKEETWYGGQDRTFGGEVRLRPSSLHPDDQGYGCAEHRVHLGSGRL